MQKKVIRSIVRKQLKNQIPGWRRLSKRQKKDLARKVMTEVKAIYDFTQSMVIPLEELLGIEEQTSTAYIMDINGMNSIKAVRKQSIIIELDKKPRQKYVNDKELQPIDGLLDNDVINDLLYYEGCTPTRRFFPSNFFRSELLKAIKYPEISYRKFCTPEYMGMERKCNRAFMGLPLNRNFLLDHTQLSQFRSTISFSQMSNLLVYILFLFVQTGFSCENPIYGADSTELAIDTQKLVTSIEIENQTIKMYDDLDCDEGKRRNKRDKSPYFVGYRMHTRMAINPQTGKAYPLLPLLAPSNHHDSHFLIFLVKLGKALGLDLKLVIADEAYHDKEGQVYAETGVKLLTPPRSKVILPDNVDKDTLAVYCHSLCEIPMKFLGSEGQYLEYKCSASKGDCPFSEQCPLFRLISLDNSIFQRIPQHLEIVDKLLDFRKDIERPFNLMKKREGLEQTRVRSQHSLYSRTIITDIATLLIEMAGTRRKMRPDRKDVQLTLAEAA